MANTVIIKCSKCGQRLRVPSDKGNLNVVCPRCRNDFRYQSGSASQGAAPEVSRSSFRDELLRTPVPAKPTYYSDEQVYQMLLLEMYEHCIKSKLRMQYLETRSSQIETQFRFDTSEFHKEFSRDDDVSGYRRDSSVYCFYVDDYEGWRATLGFQPLYKMEVWGGSITASRKRFVFTPLGQRVYNDLSRIAAADGVTVHEPLCTYFAEYNSFGSKKTFQCNPKLNQYFYGKDPGHYTHSSGYYIKIPVSITL